MAWLILLIIKGFFGIHMWDTINYYTPVFTMFLMLQRTSMKL